MGTRTRVILGIGCAIVALGAIGGIAYAHGKKDGHPDTVVVPGVRSGGLLFAFDQLRGSGLRVAIPSMIPFRETSSPSVRGQTPRGGTRVKWDSVVTLDVDGGLTGSPSGPQKLPVYRVPDFTGKSLNDVVAWTKGKSIFWKSDLPPLPPSSAKHLFDAYVIKSQHPLAGSTVKLWQRVQNGVRLTPVVLEVEPR
jgi:hypothetical protein